MMVLTFATTRTEPITEPPKLYTVERIPPPGDYYYCTKTNLQGCEVHFKQAIHHKKGGWVLITVDMFLGSVMRLREQTENFASL